MVRVLREMDPEALGFVVVLFAVSSFLSVYLIGEISATEWLQPCVSLEARGPSTGARLCFRVPDDGATPLMHALGATLPVLLALVLGFIHSLALDQASKEPRPVEVTLGAFIGTPIGALLTLPLVPVLDVPFFVWPAWVLALAVAAFAGAESGRACAVAWTGRGLGSAALPVLRIVSESVFALVIATAASAVPLGLLYVTGNDHLKGKQEVESQYYYHFMDRPEVACSQGGSDICVRLAEALGSNDSSPETSVKVRNLLSIACASGRQDVCGRASTMYRTGEGGTVDIATARDLATIGCDGYDGRSCFFLGEIMEEVGEEPSRIISVLELSCNLHCSDGCYTLAVMREAQGRREQAYDLFLKACRMDSQPSCREVGRRLREGEVLEKDLDAAYRVFEKACQAGDLPSCHEAGLMLMAGDGVTKDPDLGLTRLKSACDAGHEPSCETIEETPALQ